MTAFTKKNLVKDGAYVHYLPEGGIWWDGVFVARFKNARGSIGPFMTFLRKNFTVEEYFARMEAGESPLGIAESKGYLLSHIKIWLRKAGYPTTTEGYAAWRVEEDAAWRARAASE